MEEAPRELNTKTYMISLKEEEVLNQWLDEQLKAGLIMKSKSRYAAPYFYIPNKDSSCQDHWRWTLFLFSFHFILFFFSFSF